MSESKYMSRKEVAILLECTVTQVRDLEGKWGIKTSRRDLSKRQVRYIRSECIAALKAKGLAD